MKQAVITWIGGPVLRARMTGGFSVYEAISVGPRHLLGEVIQLKGEELVAQVYEDTTGLEPGDTVAGTGRALSVQLGPGLLGGIFDGLLRPLTGTDDFQIQAGLGTGVVGRFTFTPQAGIGADIGEGLKCSAGPAGSLGSLGSLRSLHSLRYPEAPRSLRSRRSPRTVIDFK